MLKRILSYTRPYLGYLILSMLCAVMSVLSSLASPVLIGKGIDLIIRKGDVDFVKIPAILIALGITVLLSACFQWLMSYFNNIITYRTVKDLRFRAFDKLNTVPLKYIDAIPHGDIINRVVNDIDKVSDALLQGFTQLFTGFLTILGTFLFMLSVSGLITLIVAVLTPLSLFAASFIAKGTYKHSSAQASVQGELSSYINELVGNHRLVKAYCYEDKAQEKFDDINRHLYKCGFKAQFYSALVNPTTRFVNGIIYAAVGVIGAISALNGVITVGQISMFLSYANQYTKPFNEISDIIAQLQSAIASAERVFAIIDMPDEIQDSFSSIELKKCEGNVELKKVNFSYSNEKKLIENLNLSSESGSRTAIVGPTGCGKTTLINLLMRFYELDSGLITVDGNDITNIKRNSLRRCYGMVLQETWLFTGTVRENIAYAVPEATMSEIEEAAKKAHAHSFITRLPNGYDTVISDDNGSISQGQKQLLCIARVMLLNAPMLILDEATSNIDTRTEIAVQRAFSEMMKGRTSFIVAHRLSTIKEADLILVMNNGKIVEQGTHSELIEKSGFYAELCSAMNK